MMALISLLAAWWQRGEVVETSYRFIKLKENSIDFLISYIIAGLVT